MLVVRALPAGGAYSAPPDPLPKFAGKSRWEGRNNKYIIGKGSDGRERRAREGKG